MELMDTVDDYIPQPTRVTDLPFLMPIEDVFGIKGRGTVVTGRVERGSLNMGEEVEIVGFGDVTKTVATGLEMFHKNLDHTEAGDAVGILLRGVDREAVERGQVLAKPASIQPHVNAEAEVYVLSREEGGRPYTLLQRLQATVLYPDLRPSRDRYSSPRGRRWLCPGTTSRWGST